MPFVKLLPSNVSLCRRKSSGTIYFSSVMILTSSGFLGTTFFLMERLRDLERDLVTRLSVTAVSAAAVWDALERFDPRLIGCELLSLFTPAFVSVDFLFPPSFFVGLVARVSSLGLAPPLHLRLGLMAAVVLVDVVDFFFFVFCSFVTVAFASDSPLTLATSP